MSTPRLWVWAGSPDGDLDDGDRRYVMAREMSILNQPCVVDALTAERNLRAKEWGRANEAERLLAANEGRIRNLVDDVLVRRIEALKEFVASVEAVCSGELARGKIVGISHTAPCPDPRAALYVELRDRARALLEEMGP